MEEAYAIQEWMRQNGYSLPWVAERLGMSPEALSKALESNCISYQIADGLYAHFGIRIIADGMQSVRGHLKDGALQVRRRETPRPRMAPKLRPIDLERDREDMRRSPNEHDHGEES